jgi:hypothetical protein
MSMSVRSRKRFTETTRRVWAQLFGIFMRKAREAGLFPLDGVARLAGMTTEEWLAMENGQVPVPAQLDLIGGVLGLNPEQMAGAVRICRDAWD